MIPNCGHRCSISIPLVPNHATKIYGKWLDPESDSGQLLILTTDDKGEDRVDLLLLPNGGFASLVEAFGG